MIILTTFGRFQASEKNTVMDEKMWRSAKVGQLFVYLVMMSFLNDFRQPEHRFCT